MIFIFDSDEKKPCSILGHLDTTSRYQGFAIMV